MIYIILVFAGISAYVALRSPFPLFKFMAAVPWIALLAYIAHFYGNTNWSIIAYVGCIGMACAFPLAALSRGLNRQNRDGNYTEAYETHQWHLPDWMKGNATKAREEQRKREDGNDAYREKMRKALRGREDKRR